MATTIATQLRLPFDVHETREERLRRVLAGVPKVSTAARYFTEQAAREATERATAGELGKTGPSGGLA